ncbi:MAG: porin [Pseudomonadales bacterium]
MKKTLLALTLSGLYASAASAATPTIEEMWEIIQQQQAEISRLKGDQKVTDAKVEATAEAIDSSNLASVAEWVNDTSFGGYGEMHYNNLDDQNGTSDKDEIDLHRFVLFFGHEFTDDVRFFSEFEVEHSIAGEGKSGEVEIEQAYIEWDYAANHTAKAGVFLVPVGIINETHEPDTFYGTERNPVEKNIIPATWWEGGVSSRGEIAEGWSYDVALHSGLEINAGKFKVRDGRQKVSKAAASNGAVTARVKYTGIKGLELAATVQHQTDVTQNLAASNVDANLFEAHAAYQNGPFQLRALYAMWDLDDGINAHGATTGADEQEGFYIEPSYKITEKLGIFARYNEWDNQAGDSSDSEYQQVDLGVNYWLTPTVVLKADYQDQDAPTGKTELDGLNLGVGWSF